MGFENKVFCRGIICDKWNRKTKCYDCEIWICNLCTVTSMVDKKPRCINCYLKTFSPDWDKMNKEFDEMLQHNKKVKDNENEPTIL